VLVDLATRPRGANEEPELFAALQRHGERRYRLARAVAAVVSGDTPAAAVTAAEQLAELLLTIAPQAPLGLSRVGAEGDTGRLLAEARRAALYASLNLSATPARLEDHPVEEALVANPQLRAKAAALLEPLEAREDFVLTLYLYLAYDRDRNRVARSLAVHPRTVDYRLRRVASLTGRQPQAVAGGLHLVGALIARAVGQVDRSWCTAVAS
jgi:DNA-binding PucR family transcriptional regulator